MKKYLLFIILFFIIFFVTGKKIATFDEIYKPMQFRISGSDLYILDGFTIKLFSMKDFRFITQFGKKGEGPGEFNSFPQIMVFPDHVFVSTIKKVSFFTRKGKLIKEKRIPSGFAMASILYKAKDNYIENKFSFNTKNSTEEFKINILDSDFNVIKEIFSNSKKEKINPKKREIKFLQFDQYGLTDGNYFFVKNTEKGFYIEIYDHTGTRINTINRDYKRQKVSEEFKKKAIDKMKARKNWDRFNKNTTFIFPEYFPAYKGFRVNIGKIYVFTFKTEGDKGELIILDFKGNLLKKTFISEKRKNIIHDNKFYYLYDNEDEEVWELHVVDL